MRELSYGERSVRRGRSRARGGITNLRIEVFQPLSRLLHEPFQVGFLLEVI